MDNKRLVLEYNAMRERWGERPKLCRSRDGRKLWWEFDARLEGNTLPIKIAYPSDYPATPPQIITTGSLPADTPHIMPGPSILRGKKLCWYYPADKRNRNQWSPSRDTAAMCISVAQRWFLAFLVWYSTPNRKFEDWPVPDAVN